MNARAWIASGLMVVTGALAGWPGERLPQHGPLLSQQQAGAAGRSSADVFLERHAEVLALLDAGAHEEAGKALRALLADDGLREEVLRSADAVRRSVVRCAFERSYREPDIAGLLGVHSASWNRRSGRLQAVFDRESERHESAANELAEDAFVYGFHPRRFTEADGVRLFDVPFSGRCQIAVSGRMPEHKNDRKRPPQLVLRVDDRLSYTADYTWPTTYRKSVGLWSQGTIYEWRSGVSRLLATDPTPGGKYDMMWGERYDLKLVVKSASLAASLQGYGMLSVRKDRRAYGRLGFRWCPSIDRVSVSGIVERGAIESLRSQHKEAAFASFSDPVGVDGLLPEWLRSGQGG